nr:MAG TPA: hypothetical protein [Inoviridae sp.]
MCKIGFTSKVASETLKRRFRLLFEFQAAF